MTTTARPDAAPRDLFDVAGRSIVITGATGALGGAAARGLAARGARLTLAGADGDGLKSLADELGGEAVIAGRRPEAAADAGAIVAAARGALGRVDGRFGAS